MAVALVVTTSLTMTSTPTYAHASEVTASLEQGDAPSALATAKQTGKDVKITSATTERAEYYATPNGKVRGVISPDVVRFRRNGAWVPVDLRLHRQADGSITPAASPADLRISGARPIGSEELASMGADNQKVTVGWKTALPEPRLSGSKATYPDVIPGVDLVVQATTTGFEQFTVLKSPTAAKYVSQITLPMTGPGVASASKDGQGRLRIADAAGQQRISIPAPMMWDARTTSRGGPAKPRPVTADLAQASAAKVTAQTTAAAPVTLTLTPEQQWLTSPDTVYPVTIDPAYDWSTTATSTTVVKGYSAGWPDADSLFVGTYDDTWSARSFVSWWASGVAGMEIDAATLHFSNPYSTSCDPTPWEIWTTDPITDDTSWDNQPAWRYKEATSTETSCDGDWVSADVTPFFQKAAVLEEDTPTMGLRAADETDTSQYKQFWSVNYTDSSLHPYIEVWYQEPQCSLPLDQRTGAWVCDDETVGGTTQSTAAAQANMASPGVQAQSAGASVTALDENCPRVNACWRQYSVTDSDFLGSGTYGYGKTKLGNALFTFEVKTNGAQSVSKPLYFYSTRGTKTVTMEAERLYTSTAQPAGKPVKPSTYSLYGPISNVSANTRVNWSPNGFKSYENTTAWMTVVHQVTWTDPSSNFPGRWYYFAKSIKAKRQSSGAYYFQGSHSLPTTPDRGSWAQQQ